MKKVVIVLFIASAGFTAIAQKIKEEKVLQSVRTSFQQKFPGTTNANWEMNNGNFEANFLQEGKKMNVIFDNKGTWLSSETAIEIKSLPFPVLQYVAQNFDGKQITEASRIEKANIGNNYKAVIDGKILNFGPNGQFLNSDKK